MILLDKDGFIYKEEKSNDSHYILYNESWKPTNPFNRIYQFHKGNTFRIYFYILLEMSPSLKYRGKYENKDKIKTLESLVLASNNEPSTIIRTTPFLDNHSNDLGLNYILKSYMKKLKEMKIIHTIDNDDIEQWFKEVNIDSSQIYTQSQYYMLSDTIDNLLENMADKSNIQSLVDMIQFFSQYYVLGSIGTHLIDRINYPTDNYIHYKNNYIMSVLYDFNPISLLIAIDKQYYCYIEYQHGTKNELSQHFVYPLEIRISVKNGREHLIYYDMITKRISSLRLDFMDDIILYDSNEQTTIEETIGDMTKTYQLTKPDESYQKVFTDIINNYIWGVDTNLLKINPNDLNDYQSKVSQVTINFKNNFVKQIQREKRHGNFNLHTNKYTVNILAPIEMRPWLRSVYSYIKESDNHTKEFIINDISNIDQETRQTSFVNNKLKIKGSKISEEQHYGSLFNELFSYRGMIIAESYLEFVSQSFEDTSAYHHAKAQMKKLQNELESLYQPVKEIEQQRKKYENFNKTNEEKKIQRYKKEKSNIESMIFQLLDSNQNTIENYSSDKNISYLRNIHNLDSLDSSLKKIKTSKIKNNKELINFITTLEELNDKRNKYTQNIRNTQIKINDFKNAKALDNAEKNIKNDDFKKKEKRILSEIAKQEKYINTMLDITKMKEKNNVRLEKAIQSQIMRYNDNVNQKEIDDTKFQLRCLIDSDTGEPLYKNTNNKHYLELLPLEEVELRWLKTVINHPFAKVFLNNVDIESLNSYFDSKQILCF